MLKYNLPYGNILEMQYGRQVNDIDNPSIKIMLILFISIKKYLSNLYLLYTIF